MPRSNSPTYLVLFSISVGVLTMVSSFSSSLYLKGPNLLATYLVRSLQNSTGSKKLIPSAGSTIVLLGSAVVQLQHVAPILSPDLFINKLLKFKFNHYFITAPCYITVLLILRLLIFNSFMSEYFRRYIKKQHYPNPPTSVKFKTTFKNCVLDALIKREWKQTYDDDWNMMWCEKQQVDWVFEKHRMLAGMKVNHFRGWYELCRKDMLNKNLKKFKRNLQKQNNKEESNEYDFLPSTYLLPSEYVIFYEEFKKYQNDSKVLWIMKPTSKCQGKGIFIFNKINDIAKWKTSTRDAPVEQYVCQRYLLNPLLFGGRKFDMRIYALCTNYQPLTIYLYRAGFARFAHDHYDNTDTQNLYKHLTNVAININAPTYVKRIGGKWFLEELKKFMFCKMGIDITNKAFHDIQRCIIRSMQAVQKLVTNCPQSFQLYGFDFIFDSNGKAWLLEVNGGPSMSANTRQDEILKVGLIDDTMTVINIEGILKGDQELVGGYDMIYKGKEISVASECMYTSMLGAKNNRIDNIKKLARTTAYRLANEFIQKSKAAEKSNKKVENKFTIKQNGTGKVQKAKYPQTRVSLMDPKRRKPEQKQTSSMGELKKTQQSTKRDLQYQPGEQEQEEQEQQQL